MNINCPKTHLKANLCFVKFVFFGNMVGVVPVSGRDDLDIIAPSQIFNPLSPGVLDPGNYPGGGGGPQDPQLYFGFFMPS